MGVERGPLDLATKELLTVLQRACLVAVVAGAGGWVAGGAKTRKG